MNALQQRQLEIYYKQKNEMLTILQTKCSKDIDLGIEFNKSDVKDLITDYVKEEVLKFKDKIVDQLNAAYTNGTTTNVWVKDILNVKLINAIEANDMNRVFGSLKLASAFSHRKASSSSKHKSEWQAIDDLINKANVLGVILESESSEKILNNSVALYQSAENIDAITVIGDKAYPLQLKENSYLTASELNKMLGSKFEGQVLRGGTLNIKCDNDSEAQIILDQIKQTIQNKIKPVVELPKPEVEEKKSHHIRIHR